MPLMKTASAGQFVWEESEDIVIPNERSQDTLELRIYRIW